MALMKNENLVTEKFDFSQDKSKRSQYNFSGVGARILRRKGDKKEFKTMNFDYMNF